MMSATNMFLLRKKKITFGSAHEILVFIHIYASACADPEWGDRGPPSPLKIQFLLSHDSWQASFQAIRNFEIAT